MVHLLSSSHEVSFQQTKKYKRRLTTYCNVMFDVTELSIFYISFYAEVSVNKSTVKLVVL